MFSQVSLSQRATCRVLSGHKESTSLFVAAEEKVATEGVAEKVAEKGGCSKDHCGGKSEIRKKERGRGDIGGAVERVRVFLEDRLRRICGQSTYEREKSELEA